MSWGCAENVAERFALLGNANDAYAASQFARTWQGAASTRLLGIRRGKRKGFENLDKTTFFGSFCGAEKKQSGSEMQRMWSLRDTSG
ncbi:hypothetical protein GCM10023155_23630 [Bremerella cremea]